MGETVTEQLHIGAKGKVLNNVRFKYACRICDRAGINAPVRARAWLIFSQSRQVNFSRKDHLSLARNDLEGLGDVLAQLAQWVAATAMAAHRTGHDDAFARKMLGQRLLHRPPAAKAGDIDGGRHRNFGRESVFGRRHLQLRQLELQLVHQPGATLCLRP